MHEDTIVTAPTVCDLAEVGSAHRQMQRHRACRIERCGWKWVAFYTLVRHGRLVPQESGPRERAHRRGIAFPVDGTGLPPGEMPEVSTVQQVLDGLSSLALPPTDRGDGCAGKSE
ncbi:hypothetical protein [Nocardia barduliensis]|uniref:hypothetical protein n=1 Tax=Nocardia barduliensis TaxID=2736643 RepID=UPI0015741BAD|nr:hypothetical protein [Nocardia barduliensis]